VSPVNKFAEAPVMGGRGIIKGGEMKERTIALKLNFTRIKHDCFRPTEYKKEWFVEFHGGTNETYSGTMVKIRLKDLEYFFRDFYSNFETERKRFFDISDIKAQMGGI